MSSGTLYKYSVWCDTESTYVNTDYMSRIPDSCPNNNTHLIDPAKTTVINEYSTESVISLVNKEGTGENWKNKAFRFTFPVGLTYQEAPPINFDIRLSEIKVLTRTENVGDRFSVRSPIIAVGYLTVAGNAGDTTLNVNPEIFNYLYNGYHVYIDDGLNKSELKFPYRKSLEQLKEIKLPAPNVIKSLRDLPGVNYLLEECYVVDSVLQKELFDELEKRNTDIF